jgi:FKBP-type peptidyl-prolyl cis-trans isomerase FklB
MKKIGKLVILSLIGIFIVFSCTPEKKYSMVKLKTQEDSVSYYLGLTYGSGLKQAKFDSIIDYKSFMKGMSAAIEGDTMPVSQFVIQTYLSTYFRELQQKQLLIQYKDYIAENKAFLEANSKKDSVVTLPSGLQYKVIREGKGPKPTLNDRIKVHYAGKLIDGTVFDSSYKRNEPAEFNVGQVIPGWVEAMQLMSVGSKWMVYIPENLAYGAQAPQGSVIKPYSTLVFEVELLEILPVTADD